MTSPRTNRVTPFSAIEASPARGALMGNRGILHDEHGRLRRRRWQHRRWIACTLAGRATKRPLAEPGHYTVLFFHDEAVSLAAGHRPCAQCRRADYDRFVSAWRAGHGMTPEAATLAKELDSSLHRARIAPDHTQARFPAALGRLPSGTFVILPEEPEAAWLVWGDTLHRWSHAGYGERRAVHDAVVEVLTPAPVVRALTAGYIPDVPSVRRTEPR